MHWRTCSQLGSSKNRLFRLFLRSYFWSSTTFCEAFFNVINVILHIVIYLTSVFKIFSELRIISGVIHKMSSNVANTAVRLIMGNYIFSPIEIVFIFGSNIYLVNCVIGGLFSKCFPQGLAILAIFISIYCEYTYTGILGKIQVFSGKVSGSLM